MITYSKVEIPRSHNIKVNKQEFEEIAKGHKSFIVTENNRGYKVGDNILIKEYSGKRYTGRDITGQIRNISDSMQKEGNIVFSFRKWSVNSTEKSQYREGHKN